MKTKKFTRDFLQINPAKNTGIKSKPRLAKSIVPRKRNPLLSLVNNTEKLKETIERKKEG